MFAGDLGTAVGWLRKSAAQRHRETGDSAAVRKLSAVEEAMCHGGPWRRCRKQI
jgi:hypothetical protein